MLSWSWGVCSSSVLQSLSYRFKVTAPSFNFGWFKVRAPKPRSPSFRWQEMVFGCFDGNVASFQRRSVVHAANICLWRKQSLNFFCFPWSLSLLYPMKTIYLGFPTTSVAHLDTAQLHLSCTGIQTHASSTWSSKQSLLVHAQCYYNSMFEWELVFLTRHSRCHTTWQWLWSLQVTKILSLNPTMSKVFTVSVNRWT